MRRAILALGLLALAACGSGGDGVPVEGQDIATAPEAAATPATLGPKATIDLQASGLTVPAQDGDETMEVPFGSQRAAAEATLAGVLGEMVSRGGSGNCPSRTLSNTEYAGLTLYFADDRFVGWFASDPYIPVATREDMLSAGGAVMVEGSTLGSEFTIGDPQGRVISGLFDGDGEGATVENLWAGEACIFR